MSADDLRDWLKQMTSAPNHVGSPHDKANAEFQLAKFREWGWDAAIETFSVLYPDAEGSAGGTRRAHAFQGAPERAGRRGRPHRAEQGWLPPYNVYGADGDVTGNWCMPIRHAGRL